MRSNSTTPLLVVSRQYDKQYVLKNVNNLWTGGTRHLFSVICGLPSALCHLFSEVCVRLRESAAEKKNSVAQRALREI